ncbi:hydroxymethylbilane synthase [Salinibacterium sp. SYSU T00001]|uniref:hydroxymethylbilane synthase n=1 Tax=Homoserinimonas sedimenticola TaxID=2986805 RepID=UPI0022356CEA|nr:hydroxymethylbilane synthase [Salinibacterium sedimenticola]MCW4384441.1 hydroxymethylbilane synthase [Salinibacterium sedimenticola]
MSATGAIRIGTRGSALALAQTGQVADRVRKVSGREVEIVRVTTEGDTSRASLSSLGGTGVFASALRESLLAEECDLVVHSLKDLPTAAAPGLRIGAVPKRADARDAFIARDGLTLEALPEGAAVGTGSPRRVAQLRARRPDLDVRDIRGNIDTRIGFVDSGELDAIVLAAAGLGRLDRLEVVSEFFELDEHPSAPGQGALAIEGRATSDPELDRVLSTLDHGPSRQTSAAERAVLARLEAGCAAPVGASAIVDSELLLLTATVYSIDGSQSLTASHGLVLEGSPAEREALAVELGSRAADELLKRGAADLAPLR